MNVKLYMKNFISLIADVILSVVKAIYALVCIEA